MKTKVLLPYPLCMYSSDLRAANVVRNGCGAWKSVVAVGTDGSVRRGTMSSQVYGNILDEPLASIWGRLTRDERVLPGPCSDCPERLDCGGGCEVANARWLYRNPLIAGRSSAGAGQMSPHGRWAATLSHYAYRRECGDVFLVVGMNFSLFGNERFVRFLDQLNGRSFSLPQVRTTLGEPGEVLIRHLHRHGMIEPTVQ